MIRSMPVSTSPSSLISEIPKLMKIRVLGGAAKRNILRGDWTGGIGLNCFNKSSFAHTCRSRACSGIQTKKETPDVASLIRAALALRATADRSLVRPAG